MTMRWTEDETIQLIELYKSFKYLWDNTSELYKNGVARKQAYEAIVEAMNMPRLTPQDVRSKIKNLRSSYYHELRKMDKTGTDKIAARKLTWFQAFKPVMSGIQIRKESLTESESSEEEQLDDSCFIEEASSNMDAYVVSIKQEYLDEMENQDEKDIAPVDNYLEPAPKRPKVYEPKMTEKSDVSDMPTAQSTKGKKTDEFQMFSNNIAAQLRRLPLDRALIIQVEVQSLIAKERIRIYKRQSGDHKDDDSS